MAKKAKKTETAKQGLVCVQPDTAGIDIAKDVIQVCVPSDRDANYNREFGAFTEDLHAISAWLKKCGIKRVIMESTGIYWVQLFFILDKDGFEAVLVNPCEVKNMNARKSDVNDAEWLLFIGSHDLYRNSFHLSWWMTDLKSLSRHRDTLKGDAAREIQHMQKAMELMNIKLSSVISDITGESGMNIVKAILAGERDADKLAALANYRCRKSREEIAKALCGTWNRVNLLQLKQALAMYESKLEQIQECEKEMEKILKENLNQSESEEMPFKRQGKDKSKKSSVHLDIERMAYDAWHTNVMSIPGISDSSVLRLLSELGPDFVAKFPSPKKFCRWCNVAPRDSVSGGKVLSCHLQKRGSVVGQVFRQAATTLRNHKSPLGIYYRKMKSRSGAVQANVSVAHKLAEIFYSMVKNRTMYKEEITTQNEGERVLLKLKRLEKEKLKIENKLAALGIPTPAVI